MRIFLLEDDITRRQAIGERLEHVDHLTVIDSCREEHKFNPPYDLVLLDHDLGGRQLGNHEDCGLQFVLRNRKALLRDDVGLIVIHSYNPEGAVRMAKTLDQRPNVFVAPFGGPAFWRLLTAAREASIIADPPAKERVKR